MWCSGIFFVCIASYFDFLISWIPFVKTSYSLVCHQNPDKLIFFSCGFSFTCSRCTGIYFGALLISLFLVIRPLDFLPDKKLLILFSAPMIMDVIFTSFHLYSYSKLIAFITGLLFGSILFFYFYKGLNLLLTEIKRTK